mgnify:CR=1 FL=1|tara:strand:- start:53 stop:472 length:420 start_codon:yes stop_codon:yes gene_type:complete
MTELKNKHKLKTKYKKWVENYRPHYKFCKSYIKTLEKACKEVSGDKDEKLKKLKVFTSYITSLKILIKVCDDDNSYEQFKLRPFKKLEYIHKALFGIFKKHNKHFPELTEEQKSLLNEEQIRFNKQSIKPNKSIQKRKP